MFQITVFVLYRHCYLFRKVESNSMANLSTAKGILYVTAKTDEKVFDILYNFKQMLGNSISDYATVFEPEEAEKITTHDSFEKHHKTYAVHFNGYGKWNYDNNIHLMKYWLNDNKFLLENYWEVVFDFSDEESGNLLLYHEVIKVTHEEDQLFSEMKYEVINDESYDYTAYNLYSVMNYDSDEVMYAFGIDDDPENDYEKERKEEILKDAISSYYDSHSVTKAEARKQILNIFPWLE